MKSILAAKPLIVRNNLQIPKYPQPFRDDIRSPASNTFKKSDFMKPPPSAQSNYLSSAKSKNKHEHKESGLVTETQLQIISGLVGDKEQDRMLTE